MGTNISVETYGFIGGHMRDLIPQVFRVIAMNDTEYRRKMEKLKEVRHYFTYEGVVEQISKFVKDPFGPDGGYLRCIKFPQTAN